MKLPKCILKLYLLPIYNPILCDTSTIITIKKIVLQTALIHL